MPNTPIEDHPALQAARLRDPDLARRNLAHVASRVPPGVANAMVSLLPEVPDPDGALNLFERLTATTGGEVFSLLNRERSLVHYALIVFAYSPYLGETLIQNTDLFHLLARDRALDRSHSREELRESFARWQSRSFETDLALLLARFKRREYIRIMLRDVLGIATLAETTAEISALADVLISEAMAQVGSDLHHRYGGPQHLDPDGRRVDTTAAVLALGKLGGNELNYSSDIDLFFLFDEGEDAGSSAISSREFFVRLAQGVSEALSRHTREGPAFRVDLRLRPQGGEGEPAVDLGHALRYYAEVAHDWELQAMIKVRHSAGNLALARRFIRAVQPYVYRAEINLAAIETAVQARERIGAYRRRSKLRGGALNVKLDRGGIRDIEFLVQCLQRVYGGKEHWLRSGGTLFSLQKLHDKGHISGRDFHELTTAYEFLRKVEHRLQLRYSQQTHRLPADPHALNVLSRSLGRLPTGESTVGDIGAMLRRRMEAVADIYNRIIHRQHVEIERDESEFRLQSAGEVGREPSDQQILSRLAAESPQLAEIVTGAQLGIQGRRHLFRFLAAAFTTADRYAAVVRSPHGLKNALQVLAVSDFLTEILVRHPEEIATLEDLSGPPAGQDGELFSADSEALPLPPWWARDTASSLQDKYAHLRREFRRSMFQSAARDVVARRSVRQSFAQNTAAAERAIAAALEIALGGPSLSRAVRQGGKEEVPGFAVLALGRLGTREFDLLSDADLIFVRSPEVDSVVATRAAERFMEALSAYTREGTTFAVDARLRPRGGEGELVVTAEQLREYFLGEAQAWEALTYSKLRFVGGSEFVAAAAITARDNLLERFAGDPSFVSAVSDMRSRLEKQDPGFNLKTSPGALYDIDFVAGALAIRHRIPPRSTDLRRRLHGLREAGVLEAAGAALLVDAADLWQSAEHAVRIATGRPRRELPAGEHARQATETLSSWFTGRHFEHGLEAELRRTAASVRALYDRLLT